ncbi:hypothetical protein M0813_11931 [Anaeramoeba flamelloides]|uniref:Uncharacterized protein n=1 Tax=Anaeramoeba flamelloides TaxID=1746091 RepID=A0ABQ8ZDA7_9EUKA|nr:hypothetical protein M0813_11931 [Anaeramoeba flamelloides]
MFDLENKEKFKKLQLEFQNIRRFKNRLQKLIEIIPGVVEGITSQQLDQNQSNNESNKRHSKRFFMPQEIKVKRSGIKYLSELTQLKKKSIERGLSIFFEKNYHLYNTREYSREWMIFRKDKQTKGKNKSTNTSKGKRTIKTNTKTKTSTKKTRTKLNKQNIRKIKHKSLPTQNFSALKRKKRVISNTQSFRELSSCEENKLQKSPKLQKTNSFNSLSDSYDINGNQNLNLSLSQSEHQNGDEKNNKNKTNFQNKEHENPNNQQFSYYRRPKINQRPKSFSYYTKYENQTTLLNQIIFPKDQSNEKKFGKHKTNLKTIKENEKENDNENEKEKQTKRQTQTEIEMSINEETKVTNVGNSNNKENYNKNSIFEKQQLNPFGIQTNIEDLSSSFHLYESDQMDEFQKRFYEITFNNNSTDNQVILDDNIHWSTLGEIWKSGTNDIFFENN